MVPVGVQVTPTCFVNGLQADVIQSAWTVEQWKGFLDAESGIFSCEAALISQYGNAPAEGASKNPEVFGEARRVQRRRPGR